MNLGLKHFGVSLFLLTFGNCLACGLDWEPPHNHFEGINEWGQLSYWRTVGEINSDKDLKLPIIIGFNPTRKTSPYVGKGWIIPLLESNIVQIDERRFVLTQPDGVVRRFGRKSPTDTVLIGEGGWKGVIDKNLITLWADCGWKLAFRNGQILSISGPKSPIYNFSYNGNGVVSKIISSEGVVLNVNISSTGKTIDLIPKNGDRISIDLSDQPQVEVINGKNVIGELQKSLHQLTLNGVSAAVFELAVDEKLFPVLKTKDKEEHEFTWNPINGHLVKDNEWSYNIIGGREFMSNAKIERKSNVENKTESWFYDHRLGVETTSSNGLELTKTYFTSGVNNGKLRRIVQKFNGLETELKKFHYDENGVPLRLVDGGEVRRYIKTPGGYKLQAPNVVKETAKEQISNMSTQLLRVFNLKKRDALLHNIGLLYASKINDPAAAYPIIDKIVDARLKSSLFVHTLWNDESLTNEEKIEKLNEFSNSVQNKYAKKFLDSSIKHFSIKPR